MLAEEKEKQRIISERLDRIERNMVVLKEQFKKFERRMDEVMRIQVTLHPSLVGCLENEL